MSRPIITDLDKLVKEYQSGMTTEELASQYGTGRGIILRWLKKSGCKMRTFGESQKLRYKKTGHPSLGRKHTLETKAQMRANHADVSGEKNPNYGKGCYGESNGNWKGGVTRESRLGRNTNAHNEWKKAVLKRDDYTCQMCHSRYKRRLDTHHILNWREHERRRFDPLNGITLCRSCHGTVSRDEERYVPLFRELIKLKGASTK